MAPAAAPPPPPPPVAAAGAGGVAHGYAVKVPVVRAILFSILSFGAWTFYWFYVTRRRVDLELGAGKDDALLHTVFLLVPVLNFVVVYWLWRDIDWMRRQSGMDGFSVPLYLVLSVFALGPIMYALVLAKLNEYWDRRSGGAAVDEPVRTVEKILVGIGAALWALFVLTIVVVIVVAATSS